MYIILKTPQLKTKAIQAIEKAPEWFAVTIDEKKTPRTIQQNKFLWGVPYKMISDFTGNTKEYVHAEYAGECLGFDILAVKGESYLLPYSTKNLTTKEFSDYVLDIQTKALADIGLVVPDPNDYGVGK